jgi:hypothetical protein
MNPIHTLKICFHKIRFNIIHPYIRRFLEWSLPFRLPSKNVGGYLSSMRASCPANLILDLFILIFGEAGMVGHVIRVQDTRLSKVVLMLNLNADVETEDLY